MYETLDLTKHVNPGGTEGSSGAGKADPSASTSQDASSRSERPLEVSQEELWTSVDRVRSERNVVLDSDWTSEWVTSRENRLGDLINELRGREHMRPLAPYRLQAVVDYLGSKYSVESLDEIILDVKEKGILGKSLFLILVSSGAAITWAHHAILAGKKKRAVYALVATVSLALVFTAFQGMEYYQAPSTISDSIYGSTFFLATVFHGFHVIIGTLFLIICGIRQHVGFEAAAWDRRDYGRSCSPRNDPKLDLGLFEIVPFNRNQRCFLVSRFFSEQIEEPNGSNSSLAATKEIGLALRKERSALSQFLYDVDEDQLPLPRYGLDAPPARAGLSDGYDRTIDASLKAGCQESCLYIRRAGMRGTLGQDSEANHARKSVLRSSIVPIGLAAIGNLFCIIDFSSIQSLVHECDSLPGRARVLNISLVVRSEPEMISDRLEDPVSLAPLAFNSQGEHSEGKPALAFSTPTRISLGGSSEPLTLSLDHKPLGGCELKERMDAMKLDQRERKHDQSDLVSEAVLRFAYLKTSLRFASRPHCVLLQDLIAFCFKLSLRFASTSLRFAQDLHCSIDQGPFELGTTRDALGTNPEGGVLLGPKRPRTYEDLSDTEKTRYDADVRATNIVLQGLVCGGRIRGDKKNGGSGGVGASSSAGTKSSGCSGSDGTTGQPLVKDSDGILQDIVLRVKEV
ncbi:cytochrome c oxidase subunit 3 [Tanacetum coccineum]|uniref:Cytochrome c oxidase subunit 3 n=1 Tax=Tanacetum coccineum TaxID=301880 RepID=A0ABQ5CCE4_9ASTR